MTVSSGVEPGYSPAYTATAWDCFVSTGCCDESAVRAQILASWRRCSMAGLRPHEPITPHLVSSEALDRASADNAAFIKATRTWSQEHLDPIAGSGFGLAILSPSLWVLDVVGKSTTVGQLARFGLRTGVSWAELAMGTNAFAMAALEHVPEQVSGEEHFRLALHPLTVSAAPVWDAQGALRGVLGLCGAAVQSHPHTLALAASIAQLLREYLAEHGGSLSRANRQRSIPPRLLHGLMLVNADGEITYVDSEGLRLLDLDQAHLVGTPLKRWIVAPEGLEEHLRLCRGLRDVEVRFRTLDGILSLLMTGEPMMGPGDEFRGISCTFMAMDRVTQVVNRFSGALARVTFADIIGSSKAIRTTIERARQAARSSDPVLLTGENGSGKLPFAQAIHNAGSRAKGPFINFDCGSFSCFSPDFVLVDLMGAPASSSSDGILQGQPSKFELAADGTLCLDRAECLTPRAQRILLSVLTSHRLRRPSSALSLPVRARIIATSDANLRQEIDEGRFLGDLLAQFGSNVIAIPSLRERREDIEALVESFVSECGRQLGKNVKVCGPAMNALHQYDWPGNISELRSVIARAAQLALAGTIELSHLPARVQNQAMLQSHKAYPEQIITFEDAERQAILRAGWALGGDVRAMADALGIGRTTLWRKMKHFHLTAEFFRLEQQG